MIKTIVLLLLINGELTHQKYYEISNKNCFDLIQDRIEQISIYSAKHNIWFVNKNISVIGGYC